MANKIVLIKKGEVEGKEFSINAGSNGRAICWDKGNDFWVNLGVDIALVRINHASNEAEIVKQNTLVSISAGGTMSNIYAITTFRDHLFVAYEETIVIGMIATQSGRVGLVDKNNLEIINQRFSLNALLGSKNVDLSFDGLYVWLLFQPSGTMPASNWRMRMMHWPTGNAFIRNVSLGTATQLGLSVNRGGSGLWQADRVKGVHLLDENAVKRHSYTVTHAGTMRTMDDTGPVLAFMFN